MMQKVNSSRDPNFSHLQYSFVTKNINMVEQYLLMLEWHIFIHKDQSKFHKNKISKSKYLIAENWPEH